MNEQVIICPYCKKEIPLTEAIAKPIKEKLREEFETQAKKNEEELEKKVQALSEKEKEFDNLKKTIEDQIQQKVEQEKVRLEKEAQQKAQEIYNLELKDLKEQIEEKEEKLKEAQEKELELRKKRRKLEEEKEAFELKMERTLDEERENIKKAAVKKVMEEFELKDFEKDKQINDFKKQIEELRIKADQGSQQLHGEVFELKLEDILKSNFSFDRIEPVPKGIKGADILQKVYNQSGKCCGTIIWEIKRTKTWSDQWITKLKDDQREINAEIAVIMTAVLPKDVSNFANINGIWVTDFTSAISLTTALRFGLIQVANIKLAANDKGNKMEILYDYFAGIEFKQKVEAIVEAFDNLLNDLEKEKRAMTAIWSKREKQIQKIIYNTSKMYGDMQGIIGSSMPQIKSLEFKELTVGENSKDE